MKKMNWRPLWCPSGPSGFGGQVHSGQLRIQSPAPPPLLQPKYPNPPNTSSNHGNNVLQIRGLDPLVPYEERDQVFYGLGATSVHNWPYYTIAYFHSEAACHSVIRLLHQRHWRSKSPSNPAVTSQKRLRIEFLRPNQTESRILNAHTVCDGSLKRIISRDQESAFQSAVSLAPTTSSSEPQLPPFRFPPATPSVISRIGSHLLANTSFYHNVLLLMLKMGLHPPFDQDNAPDPSTIDLPKEPPKRPRDDLLGSDESELEAEEQQPPVITEYRHPPKRRKRKRLKTGFVGEKTVPEMVAAKNKDKATTKPTTTIEEAFEGSKPKNGCRSREIKVVVAIPDDLSATTPKVDEEPAGHFGTLPPAASSPPRPPPTPTISFDLASLTPADLVTDEDLASNLLPRTEWLQHKVFAGFKTNPVCNRLYIKNLHKSTSLKQLYALFGKFIDLNNEEHLKSFSIIKLDRGRMHGQAFVTLPSEAIAETAQRQTNGYIVHRDDEGRPRPIVVNFALSKK